MSRDLPFSAVCSSRGWPRSLKSAVLHVISLAQFAIAYTRGWAANSPNARIRLSDEKRRLTAEIALLREQIRIKDARMASILPQRRPHYPPAERLSRDPDDREARRVPDLGRGARQPRRKPDAGGPLPAGPQASADRRPEASRLSEATAHSPATAPTVVRQSWRDERN